MKPWIVRNPISLVGAVITTIAAVVFLVVFFADLLGLHENPYLGIVFFLVLPGLFIVGLILEARGCRTGHDHPAHTAFGEVMDALR